MDETTPSTPIDDALREVARTRRIAAAILRGPASAEIDDVLQEASVAALAPKAPRGGDLAGWLRGAVRHLSVTVVRRRERRERREREAARPVALPSAVDVTQRLALQRRLLAEVEALPEPLRGAIVRRYLDDVPPRAIAAESGAPLATVKTRLRRALALLRERLEREWGEQFGMALVTLASEGARAVVGAGAVAPGGLAVTLKAKLALAAVLAAAAAAVWPIGSLIRGRRPHGQEEAASNAGAVVSTDAASAAAAGAPVRTPVENADTSTGAPDDATRALSSSRRARLGAARVASLRGRVVDERGAGCSGVSVDIVRPIESELNFAPDGQASWRIGERHRTNSGPDGSFVIDDLARGSLYDIFGRLTSDGRRARLLDVLVDDDVDVVLNLRSTMTVEGTVVDARDGSPVAHATVAVRNFRSDGVQPLCAQTREDGRFTIREVLGGRTTMVFATTPDGRNSGVYTPPTDGCEKVTVRLEVGSSGVVGGRVVDADHGEPVVGAFIFEESLCELVAARTDGDGAFRLRPGVTMGGTTARVLVVAADFVPTRVELRLGASPDEALQTKLIRLSRGLVAKGRVVAKDGSPVAEAVVLTARADDRRAPPFPPMVRTSVDGSFRLAGIASGSRHVLLVRHDDCEAVAVPFPEEELTASEVDLGTIRVGPGAFVAGTVVNEVGEAVAHAGVAIESPSGERHVAECVGPGRFAFARLPAGRWRLTASANGSPRHAQENVVLREEEFVDDVSLVLPTGLGVAGRVVDARGVPVAGASCALAPDHGDEPHVAPSNVTTTTDADGGFHFSGLADGARCVLAVNPPFAVEARLLRRTVQDVPAGARDLTIVLDEGDFVVGTVLDECDRPITGAGITLAGNGPEPLARGVSKSDGSFRLLVPVEAEGTLEVRVRDEKQPVFIPSSGPIAAALEHVRAGGMPLTLRVKK